MLKQSRGACVWLLERWPDMAGKKNTQRKLDVHASDVLSMVTPPSRPKVEIVLEKLTVARAKNWRIADIWRLDEACALFNGLEPLVGWEPDIELRRFVMRIETASIRNLIVRQFRASRVPEELAPIEWLEHINKSHIEITNELKSWLFDDETIEQISGNANIKETKEQRGARLLEWYEEEEAIKKRGSYNRVTERESKRTGKKEDRSNLSKLIKKTRIDLQNQAKKDRLNNPVLPTSNSPFGYLDRGNNN